MIEVQYQDKIRAIFNEKFVVDEKGKRTAVIINIKEYARMLQLLEESQVLKIIREGEKEYKEGKLKPIHTLSELSNAHF